MICQARYLELFILYISYGLFLVSALLITRDSSAIGYAINILNILLVLAYLLGNIKRIDGKVGFGELLLILFTLVMLLPIGGLRADVYTLIFYIKIILFLLLFKIAKIRISDLCKFLNITYVIYCFLSLIIFFNLLPISLYEKWDHPTMYVDIGPIHYYIFYGLEGGASYIDSYSGFILMVNIFLNKSTNRKYFIALTIFFILYTLKLTPLAGLLFSFAGYFIIKNSKTAIAAIVFGNLLFICVIYWLVENNSPFTNAFWEVMYIATHGRSMIWEQQVSIMIKEYSLFNYFFGGYDTSLFSIPALQVWGAETGDFYDNPHNAYLLLFFRSPLLFILYYISFLVLLYKQFDRSKFAVLLFILVVSYTNMTIISLQNPVYLFTLLYLLSNNNKQIPNEDTVPASRI